MKFTDEVKVGIAFFIVLAVLIFTIFFIGKIGTISNGYEITLTYKSLNSLKEGAPVKIGSGYKIGHVKEFIYKNNLIHVLTWINNKFKIRRSSEFYIVSDGILGEKYINIILNEEDEALFNPGETIAGHGVMGFDQALNKLSVFMNKLEGMFEGEDISKVLNNFTMLIKNLNDIARDNKENVHNIVKSADTAMKEFMKLSKNLESITKSADKTLKSLNGKDMEKILANITDISESLKKTLAKVAKDLDTEEGKTVLSLFTDKQLIENIKKAVVYLRKFSSKISKDPSILLWREEQ
jgi:phospholipid/cholesterol/gamma-HCH transport system substrate-binding protein